MVNISVDEQQAKENEDGGRRAFGTFNSNNNNQSAARENGNDKAPDTEATAEGGQAEAKPQSAPAPGRGGGSSFGRGGGRGSGFGGGARQAEGADGTDFGDRPSRTPGTGANNAPLGGGGAPKGGFAGGRGGSFGGGRGGNNTGGGGDGETDTAGAGSGGTNGFGARGGGGFAGPRGGGSFGGGGRGGNEGGTDKGGGGSGFGRGSGSGFESSTGFGGRGGGASFGGRGGGAPFGGRGGRTEGGSNAGGGGDGGSGFGRGGSGFGGGASGFGGRGGGSGFGGRGGGSSGFGGDRGGDKADGFGFDRTNRDGPPNPTDMGHVPTDRTVTEILEEDTRVAENYKTISEEDEECVITGLPPDTPEQTLDKWADAGFEPALITNIERSQYLRPRKIQAKTIPLIMDGHDLKGHAETGSGKSAAFLLPIINTIMKKKAAGEFESKRSCPYALIIEPTRELTYQLYDQARKLAENTKVSVSKAYGRFKRKDNLREISLNGCDILIGTPGRLVDFFTKSPVGVSDLELDHLKILVLDEADQLLDDQFSSVLRVLPRQPGWPKNEDRQTLLFSATFAAEVQQWANEWLKKENVMVSNKKLVDANTRVMQKFLKVSSHNKNAELLKLLQKEEEEARKDNPANPVIKRTMVFVNQKRTADVVSNFLCVSKLNSTTINGDRPQKLREESLAGFRGNKFNVLVTTDVCARGIDIKELDHVVNMDMPPDYTTYVHRIGRTGRLKEGTATSFFDPAEDMELAKALVQSVKSVGQEPPDWLELAAEGKLPPDETEVPAAGGGWGGGFPGFAKRAEDGVATETAADETETATAGEGEQNNTETEEKKPEEEEKADGTVPTPEHAAAATETKKEPQVENDDW